MTKSDNDNSRMNRVQQRILIIVVTATGNYAKCAIWHLIVDYAVLLINTS